MGAEGALAPDWDDEIVAGMCVLRDGKAVAPGAVSVLGGDERERVIAVTGIVEYLTIFVLAAFVGIEVVSKVPSILHTPLMSGSNAIHGIVLVGALTIMGEAHGAAQLVLGFLAVFLATLNVVGGFVVTDRMLEMFKGKPNERAAAPEGARARTRGRWRDDGSLFAAGHRPRPRLPRGHHRVHPRPHGPGFPEVRPAGEPGRRGGGRAGRRHHLHPALAAPPGQEPGPRARRHGARGRRRRPGGPAW